MKQKVIAKKKEIQDYMGQVKTLLAKYTPPDPQKIEQAFKAGNASLNPNPSAQTVGLVFKNYAESGDQMTLSFDTAAKKVGALKVNTLFGRSEGRSNPIFENYWESRRALG